MADDIEQGNQVRNLSTRITMTLIEIVLLVVAVLAGLLAYQAHKNGLSLEAQAKADVATAKADVTAAVHALELRIVALETKAKAAVTAPAPSPTAPSAPPSTPPPASGS